MPKNMDHKWKLSRLGKFFPGVKRLVADDINNYGLLNTFGEVWPLLEHLDVSFQACGPKLDSVLTGFPQEKCDKLIASGLTPKNISQVLLPDGPSIRTLKGMGCTDLCNKRILIPLIINCKRISYIHYNFYLIRAATFENLQPHC